MTKDDITDLKTFITTTVTAIVDKKLDEKLDARFEENDMKLNEILNAIAEGQKAIERAIYHQSVQLQNHEKHIIKLEKRTA